MKNFRDLKVWERAHGLALKVYGLTKSFPVQEQYGITSQIRRAAVSIPANIAEGCGRGTDVDFARFMEIAFASASELEYLLLLSKGLELIDSNSHGNITIEVEEVKRMLCSFIQKLREEKHLR